VRKVLIGLLGVSLASGMGVAYSPLASAATPVAKPSTTIAGDQAHSDELPNPTEEKRRMMREGAIADVIKGRLKTKVINGSTVAKVGTLPASKKRGLGLKAAAPVDQYVELKREKTDKIFVILADFGNERHPDFPDRDTDPTTDGPVTFDGPTNNSIPEPNRGIDNYTNWQKDFNKAYYEQLYFGKGKGVESVKTYYQAQSSGRYSVDGEVSDWVKVKYNEARYGRHGDDPDVNGNDPAVCADHICPNAWNLVQDAANQWVADQKAKGRTDAQIKADLAQYDKWDRNDYDHDGNFNEPDGYLDHFQIVHAGGDAADSDPWQGEDALWSHRWYAFEGENEGKVGPANNRAGGTEIGNTGFFIGDYTMQPENGGLSVFVHEYGHDLGLPDDYNVNSTGDNSVEQWTLMAQSRLSAKDGIVGTKPGDIGAWQKMQLGWLDYETIKAGQKKTLDLGPEEYNSDKPQAAVVVLPQKEVQLPYGSPAEGTKQYFSGNDNKLNNTMSREIDLTGKTSAQFATRARYHIEDGCNCDFLRAEASTDQGKTWTALNGTVDGKPFGEDGDKLPAISGDTKDKWLDMVVPLNAYAGQKIQFRLRYSTDPAAALGGFFADEIKITADGAVIFADNAEKAEPSWTFAGFSAVGDKSEIKKYDNFYIAGWRTYVGYDKYLKTGPYALGNGPAKPRWADHYPYQTGLLISYWDTSQQNNDSTGHPGEGRNLYVDSHPVPMVNIAGAYWRARYQIYDAPFGLHKADSFTLHVLGKDSYIRGQAGNPLFDDTAQYWYPELPNHGVKLRKAGVKIEVLQEQGTGARIAIS